MSSETLCFHLIKAAVSKYQTLLKYQHGHIFLQNTSRDILCERVCIFSSTAGTPGSPVTSDKQVGNLVFPKHEKNHTNPQSAKRRPKMDFLPLSTVTHTYTHGPYYNSLLALQLLLSHTDKVCLLLYVMPPPWAQCLEWAERVTGHISLQLHHIPSVSLATRCINNNKSNIRTTLPSCHSMFKDSYWKEKHFPSC